MEDILYTVPETSKMLKINNNKVYAMFKAGLLKPIKLGRYKVSRSELITFVEAYKGKDLTDLNNIKEIKFLGEAQEK